MNRQSKPLKEWRSLPLTYSERSKSKLETIAIINQKGGVGKSTTAAAVGAGLILKGYRVLFIDLDAQGNISHTLRANPNSSGIMAMLQEPEIVEQAIEELPTAAITGNKERKGAAAVYGIIASSNRLAAADTLLDSVGKEYRLKEALELIAPLYDYCIIDTPPALGILTVNALTAATAAIVPAQADIYSLQGIAQLSNTVNTIKKYCNPELAILGIVLTRYNGRAIISRELAELISSTAAKLNTKAYSTKIRECTAIKESQAVRECIYTYAPKSNAAADYTALLSEIITEV